MKKQGDQPTEPGSSESDDGRTKRRAWRPKKKLKLTKESSEDDNDADNNDDYHLGEDICVEITPNHNTSNKPNVSVMDEFAFANVDTQVRTEMEDPDKLFLLSLLPHFKSIPEEMRLNVKMDMMQVLRNANYHTSIEHKLI